ncbi:MAG: hypothetical protein ACMXYF_05690 [Candidatus Woesearchaeota archaeon]
MDLNPLEKRVASIQSERPTIANEPQPKDPRTLLISVPCKVLGQESRYVGQNKENISEWVIQTKLYVRPWRNTTIQSILFYGPQPSILDQNITAYIGAWTQKQTTGKPLFFPRELLPQERALKLETQKTLEGTTILTSYDYPKYFPTG